MESLSFKKFYQRIYKSPDNNYLDWVDEIKDGYKKYINRQKNLDVLLDKSYSDGSLLNNIGVQKNLQDMAMEECPKHKVYIFGHSLDVTDKDIRELLRLIEVGASCFSHYCIGCDVSNSMSYTMSTGV